ncbi:MAG: hypothetical protein ACLR5O_00195 [Romboutsia timonensis]|uniref:hypothetical protein n=1 Tax=Romboutsia timonensis TaxID=1776391 RepID=UPI0039A1335B
MNTTKRDIIKIMMKEGYRFAGEEVGDRLNKKYKFIDVPYYSKFLKFKKEGVIIYIDTKLNALGRRIVKVQNDNAKTFCTSKL